jgi:amino acid transporter
LAKFSILPTAERINNIDVEASDDTPDESHCFIRSFSNKYIGAIFLISCIIGFFGIFIKRYYLLGITFGIPVITLGAAISPKNNQNEKKLSKSAVLLKLLLGEIGLFLMITCFSLLSSEEGKRPLPPQFFVPSVIVLLSSILLYFIVAPPIRIKAIYNRKKRCTQKVTMYFTGYTRSSSAANNDDNDNSNIYPQFVYSYNGEKFRVTDWEDKIMENGKVSSLDIFIDPEHPDEYYDAERQKKRVIDSIITLASTIFIIILMIISAVFIMNVDLSAKSDVIDAESSATQEVEGTDAPTTTEEVEDY